MEIVLIDQSSKCVILTPFSSLTEEYVWLGDPYGKSFKVTDLCEQQYLRFQGMDASLLHSELWPLVSGNHSAVHGIQEVRNWTDLKKKKKQNWIVFHNQIWRRVYLADSMDLLGQWSKKEV